MAAVIQRRVSGRMDGDFAVFLIGMRVNRWWLPHKWMRVAFAMSKMLRELSLHRELGFLGGESWFGRTTVLVTYWQSMDHLMGYAKSRTAAHLPAWRSFNRHVGTNGDVGIWHETYRVRAGDYESIYVNMMPFGLGKAGTIVEASGPRETAQGRLAVEFVAQSRISS
ncbi:MAG: DUF4188 domain-containing protein [Myxococcota bacterium]|nr:DUF4188 domain-containing protein [Myxococcota bacterium]